MIPSKQQAIAFFDAALGLEPMGVDVDGTEIVRPHSLILRAHLSAALPAGFPTANTGAGPL